MMDGATLQYRLVQRSIRPPRAVTLVPTQDDWHTDLLRMIESYARTWGGEANGLVPFSNGWEMPEPFWPLLASLDADSWAVFQRTRRALRLSDPAAYEIQLAADVSSWMANHGGTEQQARQILQSDEVLSRTTEPVPTPLDDRIRRWLAPSASKDVAIQLIYKADEAPPPGLVDLCQLTFRPQRSAEIDTASLPCSLQLLVAARTGRLGRSHLLHLQGREDFERVRVPVGDQELPTLLEFAWTGRVDLAAHRFLPEQSRDAGRPIPAYCDPAFALDTPFAHSGLGCGWFSRLGPDLEPDPSVVICGDTPEDFCYAYTRQRVVGNTYWLPISPDTTSEELQRPLLETLSRVLWKYAPARTGSRVAFLSSLTLADGQLDTLLKELALTRWGQFINSNEPTSLEVSTRSPAQLSTTSNWTLRDSLHFGDLLHEPFLGPDLARSAEIPMPSEAVGTTIEACRWRIDLELPEHVLPARWALRSILSVDRRGPDSAIRSSTSGLSLDSHGSERALPAGMPLSQRLIHARPRFPEPSEIFSRLLAEYGGTLEESDRGRYTRRMIELWGGLETLAGDLRPGPSSRLLAYWASSEVDGELGRVHQGRKYLRLRDVVSLTKGSSGEARDRLDAYQNRSIVTRGLILQCPRCAGSRFYPLEDLGPGFRCQRCREESEITRATWKSGDEPAWFYGLDEVARQGLRSNIDVPILALAALAKSARSFLSMPEAIVHRHGADDVEIDLWAIVDGRIVIGEAKRSDRLEKTEKAERRRAIDLREIAYFLTADEIVMATTASRWSERSRTNLESAILPPVRVRWLSDLS